MTLHPIPVEKTPPNIERQILGLAMNGPRDLADVRKVKPEWFTDPRCKAVWEVVQRLDADGQPIDAQLLAGQLGDIEPMIRRQIDPIWLFDSWHQAPSGGVGEAYAQDLQERYWRRATADTLTRAHQLLEGGTNIREVRLEAMEGLERIDMDSVTAPSIGELVAGNLEAYQAVTRFIPTPWKGLNKIIRGWRPGGLYVIGARPGVGKSLILQQAAMSLAQSGGTVLFETLEMSASEVVTRIISNMSGVGLKYLNGLRPDGTGGPNEHEWARLRETSEHVRQLPLVIRDKGSTTPLDVREHARDAQTDGRLAGVIVDYLQLMSSGQRIESRQQEISMFTRHLKLLAKEFDCPVIVASQLNRDGVKDGQEPTLNALRESGSIEQDADVVVLVAEDKDALPGDDVPINATVAKNRQGPIRRFPLVRHGGTATITDDYSRTEF